MEMRVKNIDIVIESEEDFCKRAQKVFSDLDEGILPDDLEEKLSFESLDSLRKVLTPKRLELLHIIKDEEPKSIYELAKLTQRNIKNIRNDLSKLEKLGLIEMVKDVDDARNSIMPVLKYDKLLVGIEI